MSSEEVIAAASLVNLVIIAVLALVTHRYANETRRIAEASRNQAMASARLADEAEKEAEASRKMAEGVLRPVIVQWIQRAPIDIEREGVFFAAEYENIGNGPAISIEWTLIGGEWRNTPRRVALAVREKGIINGKLRYPLTVSVPTVVVEYGDVGGVRWRSTLRLVQEDDGFFGNGETELECLN